MKIINCLCKYLSSIYLAAKFKDSSIKKPRCRVNYTCGFSQSELLNFLQFRRKNSKTLLARGIVILLVGISNLASAEPYRYSLCDEPGITCIQTQPGESWHDLWPDEQERDVVMRLNRMNSYLRPGTILAVPDDLSNLDRMDISPFAYNISAPGRRTIIIDPKRLGWGAYDPSGRLVNWGPISAGGGYSPDVGHVCRTPVGIFSIYNKRGAECVSTKFPVGKGGAPMPYCMFFKGGYAMHGSPYVPGMNASHGCVRLFTPDARWLNQSFAKAGTKVVVYGY